MTSRIRAIVSGHVQGVGFRANAAAEAERLSLTGWVRNRADGTVELEAQGQESDVDALLEWLRHGPLFATVDAVETDDLTPTDDAPLGTRFEIRR